MAAPPNPMRILHETPHFEPWYPMARCLGLAVRSRIDFFDATQEDDARRLCQGCPVQIECLQWAIRHDEEGIWGGANERERRRMARYMRRPKDAPPPCRCGNVWTVHIGTTKARCLSCNLVWKLSDLSATGT